MPEIPSCPPSLPLSLSGWAQMSESDRTVLLFMAERQEKLELEVAELKARLGQDSSNSSRPPSSDRPGAKAQGRRQSTRRRSSGWKPGGQPGHEGHKRTWYLPEEVDRLEEVRPSCCGDCGCSLADLPSVGAPERRQVVELPPVRPEVTEYHMHGVRCPNCSKVTTAEVPAEAKTGTGPRLTALTALLSGHYRLSRQLTADLMDRVLGVPMCKGTVQACCERVSEALEAPVEELVALLPEQETLHLDETGWRQKKIRHWLWVATNRSLAVFAIHRRRGRDLLNRWFAKGHPGVVNSDRWSAYGLFASTGRQLCWAHLLRDLQGIEDAKGAGAEEATRMLEGAKGMFANWHAFKQGAISREELVERTATFRHELCVFAVQGRDQESSSKWRGLGRDLVRYWPAVFRFLYVEGVEPTNNLAEQDIRQGVIWRKGSQGTRSDKGSRFVERILTASTTCRKQRRDVLDFLEQALMAGLHGRPPPSLVPIRS